MQRVPEAVHFGWSEQQQKSSKGDLLLLLAESKHTCADYQVPRG